MYHNRTEGDIMMDAPATDSWEELCAMAADVKEWRGRVRAIKDTMCITATKGGKSKCKKKVKRKGKKGKQTKTKKK